MLTLLEAAKLVQDPLKRGVIAIFPQVSPVLERLPFFEVNGQAYKYNIEETLPGIAFRGINETYVEAHRSGEPASRSPLHHGRNQQG